MSWGTLKLADLADVSSGGSAPQDAGAFSADGIPFVRAGSLPKLLAGASERSLELLHPDVAAQHKLKQFPAGTVLFAKSGMSATKGYIYRLREPAYVVNHLAALTPKSRLAGEYLQKVLQFKSPTTLIKDEAYPSIRLGEIKEMEVPAPKDEAARERIVGILEQADQLRRKRQRAIDYLNQLGQAIFHYMFGDPRTNPNGYDLKPLGEIVTNEDGKRVPVKLADRENMHGKYPYYGASGIIDYVDDFLFDGEKLLIGEDGANLLARSSPLAFIARGKFWVNNHAHVLAYNGKAHLRFLEYFIESIDVSNYVSGSAQPKLTQKQLNGIAVPTPPIADQELFAGRLSKIEDSVDQATQSLDRQNSLFASLQHRAFQGDL